MLKTLYVLLIVIAVAIVTIAPASAKDATGSNPPSAQRMKQYFFVLLRSGPNHGGSKEEAEKIEEGHMAHIRQTVQSGQLQIAGPFDDDHGEWRGILIYDVKTIDDARALCEADPAVKTGRLVCDIHAWWAQQGATLK